MSESAQLAFTLYALVTRLCLVAVPVLAVLLTISGCTAQFSNDYTGTWKQIGADRYLEIEAIGNKHLARGGVEAGSNYGSGSDPRARSQTQIADYEVRLFTAKTFDLMAKRMTHPGYMVDGVLVLHIAMEKVPLLLSPNEQVLLVHGRDRFKRVDG